jgi:hypothetical protein
MNRVFAEISDDNQRIEVHFQYDPSIVKALKGGDGSQGINGRRFVPADKGGPHWTVPLDFQTGKRLREEFGDFLQLGPKLKTWGIEEKRRQRELRTLALADDAALERAYDLLPRLERVIEGGKFKRSEMPEHLDWRHPYFRKREPRPYQRADISMMAKANVLNGNAPGTGKTVEYIGQAAEANRLEGSHLIVAPVTSHFDTWVTELLCLDVPGWILYGDTPEDRRWAIEEAARLTEIGEPVWLIVGYNEIRLKKVKEEDEDKFDIVKRDHKGKMYTLSNEAYAPLLETEFVDFVIDESHKTGLPNPVSLFALGASLIPATGKFSMSATPMGGKPLRLWGHLHWLEPKTYSSKWRWAERWLQIDDNGFGKTIGGLLPGMEEQFYRDHAHHLVRREKRDALPGLPTKVIMDVMCDMTPKQKRQYKQFEREAEIRIDNERLSANNVLSEYTRLKQFANAVCTLDRKPNGDLLVQPTGESGKWPKLLEKLDENGIRREDPEPGARAIVGSESIEMVRAAVAVLNNAGIGALELHGGIKPKDRKWVLAQFRAETDEPVVLCMTIDTGGVSLNLELADSVHALDEKWVPDDMIQFEERADRGGRIKPLKVYYYRTKDSIQEYIHEIVQDKSVTNANVLDVHRRIIKEKAA